MNAEAIPENEPRLGDLIILLGWPWKLALALLVTAAALLLLPTSRPLATVTLAWSDTAALACAASAALLALGGSLKTLNQLLSAAAAPEPWGNEAQGLIDGLRRLLEQQQRQVHETAAAASRAVTTGAQLSGLASSVEKHLRQVVEQSVSPPIAPALADLPIRLEAVLSKLEQALPEAALSRLELCARQMAAAQEPLQDLPAATARLASGVDRLEAASQSLEQSPEDFQALAGRLGDHVERVLHSEATLGDAARYLTETTDRFAAGTRVLETQAVRLQAMISIAGRQQAEAGPSHAAPSQAAA